MDHGFRDYLNSPQWKEKFRLVMERDSGWCQGCYKAEAMHVDHRDFRRLFDEPLYDLVALCHDCHIRAHAEVDAIETRRWRDGKLVIVDWKNEDVR